MSKTKPLIVESSERRSEILDAARWCFLNFGYSKTSLEDISKRANLSRTLLYRLFKDKADIYTAVFTDWLLSRHPQAYKISKSKELSPRQKMIDVCQLMVVEPWADMVNTPMGAEFFDACERLDPEIDIKHRNTALECFTDILKDKDMALVFLLALDGLYSDKPTVEILQNRIKILAAKFAAE